MLAAVLREAHGARSLREQVRQRLRGCPRERLDAISYAEQSRLSEDVVEGVEDKERLLLAQVDTHRELSTSLAHEGAKAAV